MKYYQKLSLFLSFLIWILFEAVPLEAADKTWSAGGNAASWSDDDNWFPTEEPTSADDVLIDLSGASVTISQTFKAKSITLGGRKSSTLTSNDFIFGTISPDSTTDTAVLNRSGGKFTLKGAGVVTVKGQYEDSNATLTDEPSFLFWIE